MGASGIDRQVLRPRGPEAVRPSSVEIPPSVQRIGLSMLFLLASCEGMGAQETPQSTQSADNGGKILSHIESDDKGVLGVNSVVIRTDGVDVYLNVPETQKTPFRILFTLLRNGKPIESSFEVVNPGTNPLSHEFSSALVPGDTIEIAPEGAAPYTMTVGNSLAAEGK